MEDSVGKVLIIGGLGSIGSRYAAILRYLRIDYEILDPAQKEAKKIDDIQYRRAIIASPTETHALYCKWFLNEKRYFLCEKPLSKDLGECKELAKENERVGKGFVVNNYFHAMNEKGFGFIGEEYPIRYNYYKTGKDGVEWDCAQLIYLNPKVTIETLSPVWFCQTNKRLLSVENIERSYVDMLNEFLRPIPNPKKMWSLTQGYEMSVAVTNRLQEKHPSFMRLQRL